MKVISKTHVGMVRDNNEDSMLIREPYLFAVADGMGGYAAGEVASGETLKAFEAATHILRHGGAEDAGKVLEEAFLKANSHVHKMAGSNSSYAGMGTTLTALYLPGGRDAYAAHVGDSRLYLFRGGRLKQITRDHSYVAGLVAEGKITPSEAFSHPQRNILLQALGVEEDIEPDIIHFTLETGDKLLLCSDGLSDMLRKEEIVDILRRQNTCEAAAALLERALDNGGRDNVTLILIAPDEGAESGGNG